MYQQSASGAYQILNPKTSNLNPSGQTTLYRQSTRDNRHPTTQTLNPKTLNLNPKPFNLNPTGQATLYRQSAPGTYR